MENLVGYRCVNSEPQVEVLKKKKRRDLSLVPFLIWHRFSRFILLLFNNQEREKGFPFGLLGIESMDRALP